MTQPYILKNHSIKKVPTFSSFITVNLLSNMQENLCEMHSFVLYKLLVICGEDGIRTHDLLTASQAL